MNLTTSTTLTDLLTKRIDAWDKIDQSYNDGLFVQAIKLEKYVSDVLTPNIRKEYGL